MKSTHCRYAYLQELLPAGGSDTQISARIARVCVLYEDLRIEVLAMAEKRISRLDQNGDRFRRLYFLRRSIASLFEFAEALRLLLSGRNFLRSNLVSRPKGSMTGRMPCNSFRRMKDISKTFDMTSADILECPRQSMRLKNSDREIRAQSNRLRKLI